MLTVWGIKRPVPHPTYNILVADCIFSILMSVK